MSSGSSEQMTWLSSEASLLTHKAADVLHICNKTTTKWEAHVASACCSGIVTFIEEAAAFITVFLKGNIPLCWPVREDGNVLSAASTSPFHLFLPNSSGPRRVADCS